MNDTNIAPEEDFLPPKDLNWEDSQQEWATLEFLRELIPWESDMTLALKMWISARRHRAERYLASWNHYYSD